MFWHVTLPNIKWGLAYGVILCNARHGYLEPYMSYRVILLVKPTLPLHIEKLFQDMTYPLIAVASLLITVAIVTLVVKHG